MSETESLGATLTPEENQFFESGGNSEIPARRRRRQAP